ncbi:MAG: hypothetical protein AAGA60_07460 [Cyanobacteria bacterium P01_E01_bin.42]
MKETFNISPLIRIALIFLYLTLTIPLPFLSATTNSPIPPQILWIGIALGLSILYGALSEQVVLDDDAIQVKYPLWFPSFFRKGWQLKWEDIQELKLRTTGQGGLVYYFVTESRDRAYLLPMRVAGFARLTRLVEEKTGIDTRDIRPLSQPWMYLILLIVTLLLFLVDAWTIWTATHLG